MDNDVHTECACRICGYCDDSAFWRHGFFTSEICSCCGSQSGIEDITLESVRHVRGYWVGHGAQWFSPKCKPENWDLLKQMSNLLPEWR
ncbi:hypothetical protein [Streptomyces sp. NPDC051162]|uniref:hypothetical protein n=1 Tax=Streptomyces sp. NPDC051162 TaxID=3154747 RepID=UPI003414308D